MKKTVFLTMAAIAFLGVSISLFYSCKKGQGAADPDTAWVGPDGTVKLDNAAISHQETPAVIRSLYHPSPLVVRFWSV